MMHPCVIRTFFRECFPYLKGWFTKKIKFCHLLTLIFFSICMTFSSMHKRKCFHTIKSESLPETKVLMNYNLNFSLFLLSRYCMTLEDVHYCAVVYFMTFNGDFFFVVFLVLDSSYLLSYLQNFVFCVPQKNVNHTSLVRHEGE